MFRRRHAVPVCLAAALLLPELSGPASIAVARPRNLLLITLDTMRADRLPAYGFTGVLTPALDRIAAEGAVFEETFAAVPLTLPSHASLFTGIYPPRHGVRDNAGAPLSNEFTTLAELLRERRLGTAAFVASSVLAPRRGLEQGFDLYSAGEPARCSGAPPARRRAAEVVDEAMSWLGRHDAEPFFAWIHLFDTHRPYDLPAEYTDRYFDPYLAAIAYEDAQIARVISHLETRGLLTSTLIVVAGDHGGPRRGVPWDLSLSGDAAGTAHGQWTRRFSATCDCGRPTRRRDANGSRFVRRVNVRARRRHPGSGRHSVG
jgi:arylsulfatase A-like enzyme